MLFGKRKRIVKRILIVEDEPLTAFESEYRLSDAGYTVVATLDSYDEAIKALDKDEIDLILSDVRLNGKRSGIDLARVAKERSIPLLFVTGRPPDNAGELALGCISKPYTDRTLTAALKAVDDHLSGRKVKKLDGFEIFVPTASAD